MSPGNYTDYFFLIKSRVLKVEIVEKTLYLLIFYLLGYQLGYQLDYQLNQILKRSFLIASSSFSVTAIETKIKAFAGVVETSSKI